MAHKAIKATCYQIFDHWKNKVVLQNGKILDAKDAKCSDHPIEVVCDWAEPECWGCGRQYKPAVDVVNGDVDYRKVWNDNMHGGKLQRCHIVPQSLGGSDDPSNMFLLCPKCHEDAPDTTNAEAFMRWIWTRRTTYIYGVRAPWERLKNIQKEIDLRGGATLVEMLDVISANSDILDDPEVMKAKFEEYAFEHSTTHWSERGAMISESTEDIVFADFLENEYVKALAHTFCHDESLDIEIIEPKRDENGVAMFPADIMDDWEW